MSYVLGYTNQLKFGKYKGLYVNTLLNLDPEYVVWVHENTYHKFNQHVLRCAHKNICNKEKVEI